MLLKIDFREVTYPLSEVLDLVGMRVVQNNLDDCWQVALPLRQPSDTLKSIDKAG